MRVLFLKSVSIAMCTVQEQCDGRKFRDNSGGSVIDEMQMEMLAVISLRIQSDLGEAVGLDYCCDVGLPQQFVI